MQNVHPLQSSSAWSKVLPDLMIFMIMLVLCSPAAAAQLNPDNPVEIGHVRWSREFDKSLELSSRTGKPLFLLFQEVPGCIGCQEFGKNVLTYPLLVEAIENEFIPVLVFNNRSSGRDAALLKRYSEPGWNYQVVRFLDDSGKDLIPRRDRVWSIGGIASRMVKALSVAGRPVPLYLQAVALEHDTEHLETAAFAMSCFWTGEYKLGKLKGVVATEAGWYDSREVTLLTFHSGLTDLNSLAEQASREQCAQTIYVKPGTSIDRTAVPVKILDMHTYRAASKNDQKKQINTWLQTQKEMDLTDMQAMKLNSLLPVDKARAMSWLSPRQLKKIK